MQLEELIKSYLPTKNVMQLATCANNQPYAVNLHYYSDENFNIYWSSKKDRRHSIELDGNNKACAVIKIHENTDSEDWVIGLTIEGTVEIAHLPSAEVASSFKAKLKRSDEGMAELVSGQGASVMYKLKPVKITIYDNKTFPDEPKRELVL